VIKAMEAIMKWVDMFFYFVMFFLGAVTIGSLQWFFTVFIGNIFSSKKEPQYWWTFYDFLAVTIEIKSATVVTIIYSIGSFYWFSRLHGTGGFMDYFSYYLLFLSFDMLIGMISYKKSRA
ncbi:MAG: hypothetical protein V2A56_10655, partial [bacterium]